MTALSAPRAAENKLMATFRIIEEDAVAGLKALREHSAQVCITSPPYFGLRDYGTAQWEGGDGGCDHLAPALGGTGKETITGGKTNQHTTRLVQFKASCGKCGARRTDNQIGLEESPEAYVSRLVEVFREVRRVLRDDGTLWLNIGSSYAGSGKCGNPEGSEWAGFVGNKGCEKAAEVGASVVAAGDEPFALRDGLSREELAYVLSELSAHFSENYEVGEPNFAVGVDSAVTGLACGE